MSSSRSARLLVAIFLISEQHQNNLKILKQKKKTDSIFYADNLTAHTHARLIQVLRIANHVCKAEKGGQEFMKGIMLKGEKLCLSRLDLRRPQVSSSNFIASEQEDRFPHV